MPSNLVAVLYLGHSRIQSLSSNIKHSRLKVDPTILIIHRFRDFLNRKTYMQPYMEGACGGDAWENGILP